MSAKFNGTDALIDRVQLNPYIISGAQTDTKIDENGNVTGIGNFLKLIYNNYETSENSALYITLAPKSKNIEVVSTLPASPDPNTFYFVTT